MEDNPVERRIARPKEERATPFVEHYDITNRPVDRVYTTKIESDSQSGVELAGGVFPKYHALGEKAM